jgi:capsular exopolysaccharide synthesis family protein
MRKPAVATGLNALSLLRALRRRQALALGVALLAAGIAAPAAWFLVPQAKYRAQARLQVAALPPKVLFRTVETEVLDDYRRYQATQQALVKSSLVLNATLGDANAKKSRMIREQKDPIAWLKEKLGVEFVAGSELMEISLSGEDPEEIARLVNAVKQAYIDEVVNVDVKRRTERHDKLNKLKQTYTDILKDRRENLRQLAKKVGSDDRPTLALRQQLAMEHQQRLRAELQDILAQKRKAEALLKTRARPPEGPAESPAPAVAEADVERAVERAIEQDPTVARLRDKLAQQREQYDAERAHLRRTTRKGTDPLLSALRGEIAGTERSLESQLRALRPVVRQQLQEQGQGDRVTRGDEVERELAMLTELERSVRSEIKSETDDNQSLNESSMDLQVLQDDIARMASTTDRIGSEVEALNVELEAPPRIKPIEDATKPVVRDEKTRYMMIGVIVLGSFFGSLFGIAFLEFLSHRVDTADDVANDLGLSVVGALPILPAKAYLRRRLAPGENDRHLKDFLESIDAMRTMLVHAARTGSHRVVMITSAVGGEGKTSLASYLATSLARSGLRILLVDADLRSPAIHRLFDLSLGAGLSEVLRGKALVADVIQHSAVENLEVVTAGRCDQRTLRVLSQGGLGSILGQLKEQFDFVVVDSSPILPVADASIIAQQVDAVLLSIFRDVSRKTKVCAALERLQSLGVRILGAVVTGVHSGLYGDVYYGSKYTYATVPESADEPSD